MALLTMLWNGLKSLGEILVPLFAKGRWRGFVGFLRWLLHFIFLALVLAGLWYLNYALGLERALRSPWPYLHKVWLPVLFFLLYLLSWLGYALYRLLGPERMPISFPEIDEAWEEAMQALNQASIDVTRVPIYLVLGRPASGEESLFQAAQLQLAVQATPRRSDAPLRIYANRDAAFITCSQSSVLGRQAELFAEHAKKEENRPGVSTETSAPVLDVQAILAHAMEEGRGPDQLTDEERVQISTLVAREQQKQTQPLPQSGAPPPPFLKNKAVLDDLRARLQHLCRLIVQERRPYCPINGMFVLIPLAATRGDAEASQIANLCHLDLQAAREVLQVECPVAVVVSDLESARGFREFVEPLGDPLRAQALGQRFALVPDLDPHEVPKMFERGIDHLCQNRVVSAVHSLFRLDAAGAESNGRANGMLRKNLRLYQFQAEIRDTRKRLARILQRGLLLDAEAPPMVAGLYLVGTDLDARGQAFVAGVFQEMLQNQNFVCWTPQALSSESAYRRMTRMGYLTLLLIVLVVAAVAYVFLGRTGT